LNKFILCKIQLNKPIHNECSINIQEELRQWWFQFVILELTDDLSEILIKINKGQKEIILNSFNEHENHFLSLIQLGIERNSFKIANEVSFKIANEVSLQVVGFILLNVMGFNNNLFSDNDFYF